MSDSIKQLLAEMEVTAQGAEDSGDTIAASWFRRYKTRLEALIGEPVAYMAGNTESIASCKTMSRWCAQQPDESEEIQAFYSIPLYRLDGVK